MKFEIILSELRWCALLHNETNQFFFGLYSPCGPWPIFSLLIYSQSVGLLGWVISSSQGLYLNTEKHIYTPNIHAPSGIRTHDHSFRESEDRS
jgi:hypothetical protein